MSRNLTILAILAVVTVPAALIVRRNHDVNRPLASPMRDAAESTDPRNPDGSFKYTNRLIHEVSPYLLQHAHNPVDWYPWGDEAFTKARREDKPIFLSVGYSTCHWCHVMERESFSQEDVAAYLNAHFVPIKVDREERPDVDALYMSAVEMMTGSGGWPQTSVLLPDGRPFFGGTYLPKDQLMEMLRQTSDAYRNRRSEVDGIAAKVAAGLQSTAAQQFRGGSPLNQAVAQDAAHETLDSLRDHYDSVNGGFSQSPKFPPHTDIAFLLADYSRTHDGETLRMAMHTLDEMALGGIHDQVGGGFHRYSTDAVWKLPHFEKMLYDNALLSENYVEAYRLTHDERYKEIADDIYGWVRREMTDPQGGFYSALDADAAGVEGSYYVWTKQQILDTLGPSDGELFARIYNVQPDGNYEDQATGVKMGANVLYLTAPIRETAQLEHTSNDVLSAKLALMRAKLLEARSRRPRPRLDDKVVAGLNGLMIGSLAQAGALLKEPGYVELAKRAAAFVTSTLIRKDGTLWHEWRQGKPAVAGFQDDYAYLADGLLDLADATGDKKWREVAERLAGKMYLQFWDRTGGGFFEAPSDTKLLVRLKDPYDNVLPSGNAVAAHVFQHLAQTTGEAGYRSSAVNTVDAFSGLIERSPSASPSMVLAGLDLFSSNSHEMAAISHQARPATARSDVISITASADRKSAHPGDTVTVNVLVAVRPGWHINSHTPHEPDLIPTALTLSSAGTRGMLAGPIDYPRGRDVHIGASQTPLSAFEGSVTLRAHVRLPTASAYGRSQIRLRLRYQACNDHECLAPVTTEVSVPIVVAR